MGDPIRAHVALGSNLGDRVAHLVGARQRLAQVESVRIVAASGLWETEPVGPAGQGAYLNAVLALDVRVSPRDLLEILLDIERRAGRDRDLQSVRWGPRVLDLDLLLYADLLVSEPGLEIPHPRLHERAFVLEPLCEIAGGLVHPRIGGTLNAHLAHGRNPGTARPWKAKSHWLSQGRCDGVAEKIES